jgi:anionic cell wall polymer biosynthesis LytR-Cps2A-Psr (LCP) family protein
VIGLAAAVTAGLVVIPSMMMGERKPVAAPAGDRPVKLTKPVDDRQSKLKLSPGWRVLDGKAAVGYVRLRNYGDGSDLARIKRQQQLMLSLLKKANSTLAEPDRLLAVLTALKNSVITDPGLDVPTMSAIAHSLAGIGPDSIRFVTVPTGPHPDDPNRLIWRAGEAEELFAGIRTD